MYQYESIMDEVFKPYNVNITWFRILIAIYKDMETTQMEDTYYAKTSWTYQLPSSI
jgi:hypothetical protein